MQMNTKNYWSLLKAIDLFCQFPVLISDHVPGTMRIQPYLDRIPGVGPGGMMIHFLCFNGNPRHKCKRLAEILKGKFSIELIV